MTDKQTKRKAKRKLSNIDFSSEGAHIALVSKDQGGPANGHDYALVMKATSQFSDEFLEKAQRIKVTMDIPEFLERFFYMREDDAETLAKLMGYVDLDDLYEQDADYELVNSDYQDMIDSKVESIDVMKSMYESEDFTEVLSQLDEDEYLALLTDQERLEKCFSKLEKSEESAPEVTPVEQESSTEVNTEVGAEAEAVVKAVSVKSGDYVSWGSSGGNAYGRIKSIKRSGSLRINENVSINAEADNPAVLIEVYKKDSEGNWKPSGTMVGHKASTLKVVTKKSVSVSDIVTNSNNNVDLEENMTDKIEEQVEKSAEVAPEFEVELVEKSAVEQMKAEMASAQEELQKALESQKEELAKAKELVAKFEAEKQEAITKARFAQLKDAVKDEAKAEILFKAVSLVQADEDFQEVVKTLADLTSLVEQSDMFVEKGVSAEGEGADKVSAVAKLLKAKNSK